MISSIIIFLIVLSVLIFVHEFGHFWAAKRNKVWVEEFGFGLPPRIFGKKIGETLYSINLLPLGGFVRLHGENADDNLSKPTRAFLNKSKKARAFIIIAGVLMNLLLGIVCFAIVYSFSGIPRETNNIRVLDIATGSPAQTSGILVGDIIENLNGQPVHETQNFIGMLGERKGEKVKLEVDRDGESKTFNLEVRENPPDGEGALGVVVSSIEIYYPPIWQRPFLGMFYGFKEALFWGQTIVAGLVKIFIELFSGVTPKDVAGPVGIFAITSQAASVGILALINFVGILSINLGILNIIPFPALDGGRLAFVFLEKALGKRVWPKLEATIHTIGMIILITLIVAITVKDVRGLISAGSLNGFLENITR